MKALIYTRGKDITGQVVRCKQYAKNKGYEVTAFASEQDDLFRVIGNSGVDVLIVSDMSRLTRSYEKYMMIRDSLMWYNVRIETAARTNVKSTDEVNNEGETK